MELENLVDFAGTAVWRRRKAEQFPEDGRNLIAADLLTKFEKEVPSLEGSSLHEALEAAWTKTGENDDEDRWGRSRFDEAVGEHLRSVGFGYFPQDTSVFLTALLEILAPVS